MYNKIYQILDEKGRAKTGIFLDGPYMGKKCILKPETVIREENCGEAAEKKSGVQLIPEKTEDASIWDNYLNILSETKETKVTEADGHRLFVEDYRKNPRLVIFGGGVPLKSGDTIIGGLGISGGTGEEDHSLAEYGLSVLPEILG